MPLAWLFGWLSVTSFTTHKQIGPFWYWFLGGWICVHSRTLWTSPTNSSVRLGISPAAEPPQVFTTRGFEALISHTGTLSCVVCLVPQLFLSAYLHTNVKLPRLSPCCKSFPSRVPVSAPPTGMDECFFFISLVFRLPYSSIFWQFWLCFVFKFVVVLLVLQGSNVYLSAPPTWPEVHCNSSYFNLIYLKTVITTYWVLTMHPLIFTTLWSIIVSILHEDRIYNLPWATQPLSSRITVYTQIHPVLKSMPLKSYCCTASLSTGIVPE